MEKQGTLIHNGNFKFDNLPDRPEKPTSQEIADIITPKPQGVVADTAWTIYSPNERVCGEWQQMVDGVLKKKPLYEKTILTTTPTVATEGTIANNTIEISELNVDRIVEPKGTFDLLSGGTSYCFGLPVVSGEKVVKCVVDVTHTDLLVQTNSTSYGNMPVSITLQYTKTTDTWQTVE